ncbi:MAG: molybdopterin molybdotransferase MoeA [Gammaproteobacteria bacterium]|nr:molybdopterin molybdotransferase MoeA [Gammaproteobacteria bacterium]
MTSPENATPDPVNINNRGKSVTEPSCMDDYDASSLLVEDAIHRIETTVQAITESQTLPLKEALNRVLAAPLQATMNVPPHTNSAMDGYALLGADIPKNRSKKLRVIATVLAGATIDITVKPGECVRIMTGAKMPSGTDTVVMKEHVKCHNQSITIDANNKTGQNVRLAGEDIAAGQTVLTAGKLLSPADLGLIASIGIAKVSVIRKVRVAFLSTGDELKPVGEALAEGQIYDSNRYTLFGMLKRFGADISDLGVINDDPQSIQHAIESATEKADVLITSGGVSVGDADYVKQIVEKIGEVNFWKIAMKPGRPFAYGKINQCLFFGLPGNPVSAMVTFYQFVLPALNRLSARLVIKPLQLQLRCSNALKKSPGRVEYQRGRIEVNQAGDYVVKSVGQQGSGILSSMSKANCFIILPLKTGNLAANTVVTVQPFEGLI